MPAADAAAEVEREGFMAALVSMAEAGEGTMADPTAVIAVGPLIAVRRVIAARQVFRENLTAMSPSSALEPDSLPVIGRMVITIPIHTMACANDGFQPAAITWKAVKTPRPVPGKRFRFRMGIGKSSPAISSFKESFFYLR